MEPVPQAGQPADTQLPGQRAQQPEGSAAAGPAAAPSTPDARRPRPPAPRTPTPDAAQPRIPQPQSGEPKTGPSPADSTSPDPTTPDSTVSEPTTAAPRAAAADGVGSGAPEGTGLTALEHAILRFEKQRWRHVGAKEQAVRDTFGLSATRYYQAINALIDRPEALAAEPLLVGRLLRRRAALSRSRSAGRGGSAAG